MSTRLGSLTHLGIWQCAWSVKGSNVTLSPHLLEGTQEYAKQQELKLAEDKVDLMI